MMGGTAEGWGCWEDLGALLWLEGVSMEVQAGTQGCGGDLGALLWWGGGDCGGTVGGWGALGRFGGY